MCIITLFALFHIFAYRLKIHDPLSGLKNVFPPKREVANFFWVLRTPSGLILSNNSIVILMNYFLFPSCHQFLYVMLVYIVEVVSIISMSVPMSY